MNPLAQRILGDIDARADLLETSHLLVAVSGGSDSMALLHVLSSLRPRSATAISVAHFDHQLRDDSHRDRELVEAFCDERGIPCHCGRGDVGAAAKENGESIEAAARRLRYAFLEATADEIGAGRIATGHTRDDQIETVLMRIRRGSGVRGLAGIPRRRGRVVRPLLDVRRADLREYCRVMTVPYIDDPTNRDTAFERNYIRLELLPAMARGSTDVERGLLAIAQEAQRRLRATRRITEPLLDEHLAPESKDVWVLPTEPLLQLDGFTRYVLFADAIYDRIGHDRELSRHHYRMISVVARGETRMHTLPGMTVRREHDFLVFYRGVDPVERTELIRHPLPLPGRVSLFGFAVQSRELKRETGNRQSWRARASGSLETGGELTSAVAYFAREHVTPPFIVRPAVPGDRMRPFGMGGHEKKLSDIFIDKKIPCRVRGTIPVVEDQRGIIWLAGVTTSETTRITGETRDVVELAIVTE